MKEGANIFRVLVKTLWNAGIITERTKGFYAMYVNFDEFEAEGDDMVGDAIAEEGIALSADHQFRHQRRRAGRHQSRRDRGGIGASRARG